MALQTLALVAGASLISSVSAHGYVSGIVAGGKWYPGSNPNWFYSSTKPETAGWFALNQDNGFVAPSEYQNPDIICHKNATPGTTAVPVVAGSKVELQWTPWPDSHHGPVIDYLAKCSGKCQDAQKTTLEFVKIDQGGLINDATPPGDWASDKLIAANNSWTVTIPASVAPGNYVLRHEIIALHSAGTEDGAQNYPQCINLQVTGSGKAALTGGEVGTKFYKSTDPGILINIYTTIKKYIIPGPALWSGAKSGQSAVESTAPSSSAAPASASAPAQSGGASYSAPAASSPASTSSTAPSATASASYSAPIGSSSSKCTRTVTLSSSSAGAVSASASTSFVAPAGSSYPVPSSFPSGGASTGGFSIPYPTGTSAPYPSISTSSVPVSPVSVSSPPAPSASSPGGYPTPPSPPSPPSSEMSMMWRIIKYIKQQFRQAEHAKDFKKF